jgi:hypothetical protein
MGFQHGSDLRVARAHDHKFDKEAQKILVAPDELAAPADKHPDFLERIINMARKIGDMVKILPAAVVKQLDKELILGFEMIVQAALGYAGPRAYHVNRGFVVAVFIEALYGRPENFSAPQLFDLLVFHAFISPETTVPSNVPCPACFFKEKKRNNTTRTASS